MTRPARRMLSTLLVMAMAVGALLAAPAGAVAGPSGDAGLAAPSAPVIDPGELQQLLDQIVAAGGPGAAALVKHEHGVQRAASGVADLRTGRPMRTRAALPGR